MKSFASDITVSDWETKTWIKDLQNVKQWNISIKDLYENILVSAKQK